MTGSARSLTFVRALAALAGLAALAVALPARAQSSGQTALLEHALHEVVETVLPWDVQSVTLSEVRLVGTLPRGDWSLQMTDQESFRGRIRAQVIDEEGRTTDSWVLARLDAIVPVVVADRAIPSGARVDGYTRIDYLELSTLPPGFVSDPEQVFGLVTRRALRAGEALRASFLDRPVIISRDDVVLITVHRGSVVVTDRGLALENGRQGEPLRIRSLSSDRVITAIVLSEGRAEVP